MNTPINREEPDAWRGFSISVGVGRNKQKQLHLQLSTEISTWGINTFFPPKEAEIIPLSKDSWFTCFPSSFGSDSRDMQSNVLDGCLGQGAICFSKDTSQRVCHKPRGSLSMTAFLLVPLIPGLACIACTSNLCG